MPRNMNFKIGDKVKDSRGKKGTIKFIKEYSHSDEILVKFDVYETGLHDGNGVCGIGKGESGNYWWFCSDNIELLPNEYEVDLL